MRYVPLLVRRTPAQAVLIGLQQSLLVPLESADNGIFSSGVRAHLWLAREADPNLFFLQR
ncbi:hypothetical protein D3C84_1148340 [compost metagenome]